MTQSWLRRKLVRRETVFKLLAVGTSLLVALLLAEMILRLFPGMLSLEMQQILRANPRDYGVAHPYIGHLQKPNSTIVISGRDFSAGHHTDGNGFRNRWPWPAEADIVVVGDSVTFGYGVPDEQAWPAVLARNLPREQVINLGLIGAGPQPYLRVYETFGARLRPKVVIVGFFATNDFWDAAQFDGWLKSGSGGNYMVWRDFGRPPRVRFSWRDPAGSLVSFLASQLRPAMSRSHVYNLLRALVWEHDERSKVIVHRFADGSQIQMHASESSSDAAEAQAGSREFRLAVEALEQLQAAASRSGARLLVVLQPGKEEVYLPLLGVPSIDYESALRPALDRSRIDYLDLTPGFRERAARGERLFFEVDGHPNAAGDALIAELVLSHLKQHARRYGLTDPD